MIGPIRAQALKQLKELYSRAESTGQTSDIDSHVFLKYLNQDIINKALVSLIVIRNLPFQFVEWPETHTLCQVLNPEAYRTITTAHSEVHKKIKESWSSHKNTIQQLLQSAITSIYLLLDI